jgi:egghead protein (zeste-white 4 protein)
MRVWLHLQIPLYLLFITGGVLFGLYQGTDVLNNTKQNDEVWWATLLRSLGLICIVHALPVFIGFLIPHFKLENCVDELRQQNNGSLPRLFIRYVTRGDNKEIINNSIKHALKITNIYENVFVELATDNAVVDKSIIISDPEVNNGEFNRVLELVVPDDYSTENNAIYKARALQYSLENSSAQPDDYIFHLDEESQLTPDVMLGIYQHMYKNPEKIGQGVITYKRSLYNGCSQWRKTFCTLADSIRIADDLSRFRFSFLIGRPIFGCKGSFILLKAYIEKDIAFDMPPRLCITEDANFAFNAYSSKYKFAYVDGQVEEISPSTFLDFIKQRARWMRGLWLLILHHPSSIWHRIAIAFGMITWSLIFLNIISFVAFFILNDYKLPTSIAIINGAIFASYIFSYLYGGLAGGYGIISVLSIILSPFFLILESVSVIYALFTIRKMKFHVIKK